MCDSWINGHIILYTSHKIPVGAFCKCIHAGDMLFDYKEFLTYGETHFIQWYLGIRC